MQNENKPIRIQRKRIKGWKLPPNTVCVTRGTPLGNPFKVGGWFMVGDPDPRTRFQMTWCQAIDASTAHKYPGKFTLIKDTSMSIEFFERLMATGKYDEQIASLRGKNVACFCKLDERCHADVLLRLANK